MTTMTPDEFIHEYEIATRSKCLEQLLRLIDDHAVYWFSNGGCHIGKAEIATAIQHNFETIENEDYRISDLVWIAQSSECAVCVYRFDWSGTINGAPAAGTGRGTSVLASGGDSWVVVHEHLSKGIND